MIVDIKKEKDKDKVMRKGAELWKKWRVTVDEDLMMEDGREGEEGKKGRKAVGDRKYKNVGGKKRIEMGRGGGRLERVRGEKTEEKRRRRGSSEEGKRQAR